MQAYRVDTVSGTAIVAIRAGVPAILWTAVSRMAEMRNAASGGKVNLIHPEVRWKRLSITALRNSVIVAVRSP
jgi:hypothetical protein